jgi:hypothetical protein
VDGMEAQLVIGRNAEEIAVCIVRLLANSRNARAYPQKVVGLSKLTAPGSVVPEKLEKLCLAAAENHRLHKELVCADCLRLRRRRPRTPGLWPSARIRS